MRSILAGAAFAALFSSVASQNCISLSESTECPAFSAASISTDATLVGLLYVPASKTRSTADLFLALSFNMLLISIPSIKHYNNMYHKDMSSPNMSIYSDVIM